MNKYKIKVNDIDNIRELLQISYKLADELLVQTQNEITKLANATRLQDEPLENRERYAKAINNYLMVKDKAIGKKMDIAKLLTEIYKHNGDVNSTINDGATLKGVSFDFSKIRDVINSNEKDSKKTQTIELKERK